MKNDQIIGVPDELRNVLFVGESSSDLRFYAMQGDIHEQRRRHASYNVAKKVLEFEFTAEIPRIHLRASYGDGFKGAPLNCEGSLTRNPGELDDQAAKNEMHVLGGTRYV
jgi:hypothetical protein